MGRWEDAKAVFAEAKSWGTKESGFDQTARRLVNAVKIEGNQMDEEILRKAVDLRESGKYDEAIGLLLHQSKKCPTDPNIQALLSHCYILNENLEQAKIYLDAAKNINPNIASIGWNETRLLLKQKKVNEALNVADKTNKLFPDDIEGMGVLGTCLRANGNFDESLKILNRAIARNPEFAEALINRGLIYLHKQDKANALTDLEKAHNLKPHIKQIWDLLISLMLETKNYSRAIYVLIKMIEVDPNHEKSLSLLTVCNQEADDPALAIISFETVLEVRPYDFVNFLNLGVALQRQGKNEKAIEHFKKALSIKPDYADAYYNMGNALKEQGKLDEAIQAFTNAISTKPDYADAYNNMGGTLKEQGKLDEAIQAYDKAISIKPDFAEAHNNIGVTLNDQGKLDEAIEAFTNAISIKPDFADAYYNMGNALNDQGRPEEAIEAYTKALSIKPDYAEAYNNMGNALKEQDKLDKAIEAYTKAISIKPDYAEAHRNLSFIKQYTLDDEQFLKVKELYNQEDLSEDQKCNLSFALAKMYEDIGKLDQTFSHLSKGNALRKKLLKYSINQDKELFTKLKNTQPHLLKNALKINESSIEATPIFVVGMPRSGTTLVEQIISSHSKVTGAGELNSVAKYGGKLVINSTFANTVLLSDFRKKYLLELSKVSNGKSIVTDKMPQNFRFIPLICASLPEAKIIHVQRSAIATCWSNYKQYFVSNSLGYSYDLRDVVEYYNLYKDLMMLWQSQYGERIYHLNYEILTTDQENQTRKLIKHIGLNWEEACLSPHKNKRSVRSASQQQVRQKVYQGSSEAWRKYEPFLNGAFDNLTS